MTSLNIQTNANENFLNNFVNILGSRLATPFLKFIL